MFPRCYRLADIMQQRAGEEASMVFPALVSSDFIRELWGGEYEKLVHSEEAIDLSRLEKGIVPLQTSHWGGEVIGVAENARIKDGNLYVDLRLANDNSTGDATAKKWRQGIATSLSIGYRWLEVCETIRKEGGILHEVTRWVLNEVSIVGVPADSAAQIAPIKERILAMREEQRSESEKQPASPSLEDEGKQLDDAPPRERSETAPADKAVEEKPVKAETRSVPTQAKKTRSYDEVAAENEVTIEASVREAIGFTGLTEEEMKKELDGIRGDEKARLRFDGPETPRDQNQIRSAIYSAFQERLKANNAANGGHVERQVESEHGDKDFAAADVMNRAPFLRHQEFVMDEKHGKAAQADGGVRRALERGMIKSVLGGGGGVGGYDKEIYRNYVAALIPVLPEVQRNKIEVGNGFPIPLSTAMRARARTFDAGLQQFPELSTAQDKLRQFSVTLDSGTKGGNLVDVMLDLGLISTPYYAAWPYQMLGITMRMAQSADLKIPRVTGKFSPAYYAEGATVPSADLTIGSFTMTPKRLAVIATVTNLLNLQSNDEAGDIVIGELMTAMDSLSMNAMLNGNGTAPNPRGILQTSGVGLLSFNALSAVSKGDVVNMQYAPEEANAPMGSKMLLSTAFAKKLASTGRSSGGGDGFLLEGMMLDRAVPILKTTQISFTNGEPMGIFALWDQVIMAMWGVTMLVVDPYTLLANSEYRVCMEQYEDIGIRNLSGVTRFDETN